MVCAGFVFPMFISVSLFGHFPVHVKFDYDSNQLCVNNYPVYLSSCLFSLFSSGLVVTPGVPVCLPCLVFPCLV